MHKMKLILEWIEQHPRIILLMAWPVFTAIIIGLILIIWKGPWLVVAAVELKRLDLLGWIAMGIIAILGLNQLAQSSSFFGKLGMKIGTWVDVTADMDGEDEKKGEGK